MNNQPASMTDPHGLKAQIYLSPSPNIIRSNNNPLLAMMPSVGEYMERNFGYGRVVGMMLADMEYKRWLADERRWEEASGESSNTGSGSSATNLGAAGGGGADDSDPQNGNKKTEQSAASNVADGFMGGLQSTWDGIKSQFTWEGYLNSTVNALTLGGYGAFQQMSDATKVISNIPNYTAADYQYGAGFMLEKGLELFLLKKAGKISNIEIGKTAFESPYIGGKSSLFGRARLGSFNGANNGILNRGYFRIGWSWDASSQTHFFQPRLGPQYGATHFLPWFKYKP